MSTQAKKTLADLLAIMAALRTPNTGCPWDLAQTFATIAPYTIEEAYEVVDAIERQDMAALQDELGDLLLQVVYHARMAEEQGAFQFADVVDAIAQKMLRRHPHVFGSEAERAAGAVPGFWERIKGSEKPAHARHTAGRHPKRGAHRAAGADAGAQVAAQSCERGLRLALAATGVRQTQRGAC